MSPFSRKQVDGLIQWFAKCGLQTSSNSVTGDLVTDTDSRTPDQTFQTSNSEELKASNPRGTRPPRGGDARSSVSTPGLFIDDYQPEDVSIYSTL